MTDEKRTGVRDGEACTRRGFLEAGGLAVGAGALGLWAPGVAAAGAATGAGLGDAAPKDAASADLGEIPKRVLGRTGEKVSILGLGTACMGEGPQDADECASVFSEAIDRGIDYVDTARIYGDAETALGRVLKTRRDKVFLATKCMTDTREAAERSFETSLKELQVDRVDLLHLHSCGDRDLDQVLGPGGAWEYLLRQKEKGRARFLGITGHNRPEKFVRMLGTDQVDAIMVAMNFADRHTYGFEAKVVPAALEHETGVMAMKVFGGIRGGFSYNRVRRPSQMDPIFLGIAVRYALSIEGLTGIVLGVHDAGELRQNIRYVLSAPPLSASELAALEAHGKRIAAEWGPRFGPVA
ncbi:MAG: aldo/keto reductase [Planctomycetes bacterium]|nr:aldo/keto reductase [Planctomycetota bacterium]